MTQATSPDPYGPRPPRHRPSGHRWAAASSRAGAPGRGRSAVRGRSRGTAAPPRGTGARAPRPRSVAPRRCRTGRDARPSPSAVRPTTSRSPDAGTGTSVFPKSRVMAVIAGAAPARSSTTGLRREPRPGDLDGGRVPVHQQPAPAEPRGGHPRRAAAGERIEDEVARAGSTPRRCARAAGPASGSDSPSARPSPAGRWSSTRRRSAACRGPPSRGRRGRARDTGSGRWPRGRTATPRPSRTTGSCRACAASGRGARPP